MRIFIILFVIGGIASWLSSLLAKRRLEKELGRKVDEHELMSLSSWSKASSPADLKGTEPSGSGMEGALEALSNQIDNRLMGGRERKGLGEGHLSLSLGGPVAPRKHAPKPPRKDDPAPGQEEMPPPPRR